MASSPISDFFSDFGELCRYMGRFFLRVWRRPFEFRELVRQMDE